MPAWAPRYTGGINQPCPIYQATSEYYGQRWVFEEGSAPASWRHVKTSVSISRPPGLPARCRQLFKPRPSQSQNSRSFTELADLPTTSMITENNRQTFLLKLCMTSLGDDEKWKNEL
jgi:hypothetical protein